MNLPPRLPVIDRAAERPTGAAGAALAHDSAAGHVSGRAVYIDDQREPAGTVHVAPGHAPAARGVITRLDLDKVRAAPGVIAVLTSWHLRRVATSWDDIVRERVESLSGRLSETMAGRLRDAVDRVVVLGIGGSFIAGWGLAVTTSGRSKTVLESEGTSTASGSTGPEIQKTTIDGGTTTRFAFDHDGMNSASGLSASLRLMLYF